MKEGLRECHAPLRALIMNGSTGQSGMAFVQTFLELVFLYGQFRPLINRNVWQTQGPDTPVFFYHDGQLLERPVVNPLEMRINV